MIIYLSDGGNCAAIVEETKRLGCRHMVDPRRYRPQKIQYALDNGAFGAYIRNQPLDEKKFYNVLERALSADIRPDFVVVPDRVAAGLESLEFSLEHINRIPDVVPRYLAVQDGMTLEVVEAVLDLFEGIFVGGTVPWKYRTAESWVKLSHSYGLPCHIGRVGTLRGYDFAHAVNADSVDGSNPVRNRRMDIIEKWQQLHGNYVKVRDYEWDKFCVESVECQDINGETNDRND